MKKPPIYLTAKVLQDPQTGERIRAMIPRDRQSRDTMNAKGIEVGETYKCQITRLRNSGHYRLAHALARHLAENCDGFESLVAAADWHGVLKRLQLESGVECELSLIDLPGMGQVQIRSPKTLAFDAMGQDEFNGVFKGLCQHIADTYWRSMTAEQVAAQVDLIGD